MINLRKMYPQYNDLPKNELVKRIHNKHYKDIPFDIFKELIGETGDKETTNKILDLLSKHSEMLSKEAPKAPDVKFETSPELIKHIKKLANSIELLEPYDEWVFTVKRNNAGFIQTIEARAK